MDPFFRMHLPRFFTGRPVLTRILRIAAERLTELCAKETFRP